MDVPTVTYDALGVVKHTTIVLFPIHVINIQICQINQASLKYAYLKNKIDKDINIPEMIRVVIGWYSDKFSY